MSEFQKNAGSRRGALISANSRKLTHAFIQLKRVSGLSDNFGAKALANRHWTDRRLLWLSTGLWKLAGERSQSCRSQRWLPILQRRKRSEGRYTGRKRHLAQARQLRFFGWGAWERTTQTRGPGYATLRAREPPIRA